MNFTACEEIHVCSFYNMIFVSSKLVICVCALAGLVMHIVIKASMMDTLRFYFIT